MVKTSKVSKVLATVANKAAKVGAGTASLWGAYQPKEPVKKVK
jgi:cyclic lactone autoinducer peptide